MIIAPVDPRTLIVPAEIEIARSDILDAYFVAYISGQVGALPPIIIGRPSFTNYHWSECTYDRRQRIVETPLVDAFYWSRRYYGKIRALMENEAEFYLYDGNHRSMAAYFTGSEVTAIELETDEDIDEIRRMQAMGRINLPSPLMKWDLDLQGLEATFERFCSVRLDDATTVDNRAHRLINRNKVDPRIINYYRADKWWRENVRVSMW